MKTEAINEALRAMPPISVGGLTMFSIPLNEWVLLLTAVYTVFLIIDKGWSLYQRWKEKRDGKSN
jgi:hypothetical protein